MIKPITKIINGTPYKLIIPRKKLERRHAKLAQKISTDFPNAFQKPPVLMGIITGGLFPLIDISRELCKINFPHKIDTFGVTPYGNKEIPGRITISKLPSGNIANEHIILIEDVVEEGVTLNYIVKFLLLHNPASIKILVNGWKKELSQLEFPIDYVGFRLRPEWLIGEGMDDKQLVRGEAGIWQKIK